MFKVTGGEPAMNHITGFVLLFVVVEGLTKFNQAFLQGLLINVNAYFHKVSLKDVYFGIFKEPDKPISAHQNERLYKLYCAEVKHIIFSPSAKFNYVCIIILNLEDFLRYSKKSCILFPHVPIHFAQIKM